MTITTIITADIQLDLADLAHSCGVSPEWIIERVQAGLLCNPPNDTAQVQFTSDELIRVRRLLNIEQGFDANPELAALVVDMMEEIERLKSKLDHTNEDLTDM